MLRQPAGELYYLWRFLAVVLLLGFAGDVCWIIGLIHKHLISTLPFYYARLFFTRVSWLTFLFEYFFLSIFLEKLTSNVFIYEKKHYIKGGVAFCIAAGIFYMIYSNFLQSSDSLLTELEFYLYALTDLYIFMATIPSLVLAWHRAYKNEMPVILKQQIRILTFYFFLPHLLCLALSTNPYSIFTARTIEGYQYLFTAGNDLLYLIALFFCIQKILTLRFLNIAKQIKTIKKYNFIDDFKLILAQLGDVMSVGELEWRTKSFFAQAFSLKEDHISLHIRPRMDMVGGQGEVTPLCGVPEVEKLLNDSESAGALQYMQLHAMLVKDEIAFDYFYEKDPNQLLLLRLLSTIKADILIPIYERKTVIGYIIIEENCRPGKLFHNIERDEMCLYARYLGSIIYLLQHRNLRELVVQEKDWQEEMYFKHQELHHAKETIKTIMKRPLEKPIGVIHYYRSKLSWSNNTARAILECDKEDLDGSPHAFSLKQVAQHSLSYRTERRVVLHDALNKQIQCIAIPYNNETHAIILLYHADVVDILAESYQSTKNLASWEYALYLETTQSGKLINQLIPTSSRALLNFKIELLQIALSKKASLLEMSPEDVPVISEIMHHISLRSKIYTLKLTRPERVHEIAAQLFGVESLFLTEGKEGLLNTLHEIGTLCIYNIEMLSDFTQQKLYYYLNTGLFTPLKSERSIKTNVRIICSTATHLTTLVAQNQFSAELLAELQGMRLVFPSLLTIPREELMIFAHEIEKQVLHYHELNALIHLNERETEYVINKGSASLHAFKRSIKEALTHKSQKHQLSVFTNDLDISSLYLEPELHQALKMGKDALKSRKLLTALWNKFKSQTKIAMLLNVHRSSVSRRYKQFNLPTDEAIL